MRYHPAIVAQAAATSASLLPGRFVLGVGTGEWVNEHIVGQGWPHIDKRREMLAEAIGLIRRLWTGSRVDFQGRFFQVEAAKIYSLPEHLPPIVVSGLGAKSVRMAGQLGDGLVSLAPDESIIEQFEAAGGQGKPKYTQINVCYAPTNEEGRHTAFESWPNAGIGGPATTTFICTR
jgi:coenzyme F420-dependent glucose-6-phosphate dehydrogenase